MQAENTVERKYALTKIAPGDYLLPSNDARTVWRIAKYTDGPSGGLEIPKDREFWGVWKWTREVGAVDPQDWSAWEMYGTLYDTRQDAIKEALRLG